MALAVFEILNRTNETDLFSNTESKFLTSDGYLKTETSLSSVVEI